MDETPMNFDMPPSRRIDSVEERTIAIKTIGNEKNDNPFFTVVLACLADGSKLKPIVIFKQKTMPREHLPSEVVVHVHEKGWMD